jgi:excisionase family DNA binding protein
VLFFSQLQRVHGFVAKIREVLKMKEICGINELATYLNISVSGVRKLVREKRIPYFKVLSCIKFDLKEIDEWLKKSENEERKFSDLLGI